MVLKNNFITLFSAVLLMLVQSSASAQQLHNITFPHEGKTVNGTFTAPALFGKFPVIIINPGSGANDRDGTIPMQGANVECLYPALVGTTLKPYKELGDALVAAGYAVLRYDKLEYSYPTSLGDITFKKLWLPVESAIDYVKTRADVDTNRIILLGHSEGSALIPFIAQGRSDIKALISVAGARTPFDSLLAYQLVHIAQTCGGNVAQAQMQSGQILQYFHLIRTNTWNAGTPPLFGVPAAEWYKYVRATDSVSTRYNAANLPTLFTGLELDMNVPPAELARFKNEVTVTKDFWSIPGLIHYMTPKDNPRVSKVLTDTIIHWLRQQGLSTGIKTNDKGSLLQIQPNPFTTDFSIHLHYEKPATVNVTVKNILGQNVVQKVFKNDEVPLQAHFNMKQFASGIYLLNVELDGEIVTKKVLKR